MKKKRKRKKKKKTTVLLKQQHSKEERESFANMKITGGVFFLFLNFWSVF